MKRAKLNFISRILIEVHVLFCFAYVWVQYYSWYVFDTKRQIGNVVTIIIYFLIYRSLAKMYRANKIGSYQIGETVLSQMISFGIADILMYVESVLINNHILSLVPGIIAVFFQIFGCVLWAYTMKRYYIRHLKPSNTVIIYGFEDVTVFIQKLERKCVHLFQIDTCIQDTEHKDVIKKAIREHETVILYSVQGGRRTDIMEYCVKYGRELYITPRIADIMVEGCQKRHLIDTPMYKYDYSYQSFSKCFLKRAFDLALAVPSIIVLSPVFLITAVVIKLEDGGPVFYKQERCTKGGKTFQIYKFRSMIVDAENHGARPCMSDDERITKIGRFIRKVRIDELPQIINVIAGDMSIVGPRPERVEHVQNYTDELPEFSYRLRVKAGLTGYAQIYGKYNTTPYDKLRLDLMYIESMSLLLDFRIVMLTIKTLFIPESTEGFEKERSRILTEANRRYQKGGHNALELQDAIRRGA